MIKKDDHVMFTEMFSNFWKHSNSRNCRSDIAYSRKSDLSGTRTGSWWGALKLMKLWAANQLDSKTAPACLSSLANRGVCLSGGPACVSFEGLHFLQAQQEWKHHIKPSPAWVEDHSATNEPLPPDINVPKMCSDTFLVVSACPLFGLIIKLHDFL